MNDRQEDLCAKLRDAVMDRGVCLALLARQVEPDALQAAATEIEALCEDITRLQATPRVVDHRASILAYLTSEETRYEGLMCVDDETDAYYHRIGSQLALLRALIAQVTRGDDLHPHDTTRP